MVAEYFAIAKLAWKAAKRLKQGKRKIIPDLFN